MCVVTVGFVALGSLASRARYVVVVYRVGYFFRLFYVFLRSLGGRGVVVRRVTLG